MMVSGQSVKPMRLLTLKEVTARTTLSKTSVYELMKEERFPKQVRLGNRSVAWVESEVDAFIESVINSRSSQEKASCWLQRGSPHTKAFGLHMPICANRDTTLFASAGSSTTAAPGLKNCHQEKYA